MIYGYARVSTTDQKLTVQINQLMENGVDRKNIFKEKKTGRNAERDELKKLIEVLQPGDRVIVTKIDRIARNLKDGLNIIETIQEKGATIEILNMGTIDSGPMGKLILRVMFSIAEFEVDINRERQREGIQIAKEKGIYKGRAKKYKKGDETLKHALELYVEGKKTVDEICEITKVSRATIYRKLKEFGMERVI